MRLLLGKEIAPLKDSNGSVPAAGSSGRRASNRADGGQRSGHGLSLASRCRGCTLTSGLLARLVEADFLRACGSLTLANLIVGARKFVNDGLLRLPAPLRRPVRLPSVQTKPRLDTP